MAGLTKEQLLATLAKQADSGDTEIAHRDADKALLAFINDTEIAAAWDAIDKWFA